MTTTTKVENKVGRDFVTTERDGGVVTVELAGELRAEEDRRNIVRKDARVNMAAALASWGK